MNGEAIFTKLTDLPSDLLEEYFDWSQAPAAPKRIKRPSAVVNWMSSGWGVAAICAIVSVSVMLGIIRAGRAPFVPTPGESTPVGDSIPATESDPEKTEKPTEYIPLSVYAENGVYYTTQGDGTCYVSGFSENLRGDVIIPEITASGDIVTAVGDKAFYGGKIRSIVLPNGVTSIGEQAFWGCLNMTEITLPETLTSLGEYAFDGCAALTTIEIPTSLTYLPKGAFYGCYKLGSIRLHGGFRGISETAFENCTRFSTVYFHGTAEEWENVKCDWYGNDAFEEANVHILH